MQLMLMTLIRLMQLRAGAGANDAHDARPPAQVGAGAGANEAHDARPSGASEGWGWCK